MFTLQGQLSNSESKEHGKVHLVSSKDRNKIVKTDQLIPSLSFHCLKNQSSKNREFSEDMVSLKRSIEMTFYIFSPVDDSAIS